MSTESVPTLQEISARVATLEKAVAVMTAEKKCDKKSNAPRGAFASLGGIEILPAPSNEARENPIDFSESDGRQRL